MKMPGALGACGLILILAAGCIRTFGSPEPISLAPQSARRSAPNIDIQDVRGITFHLSDYKGRILILNFWRTTCPPCEQERLSLQELEARNNGNELSIVSIAMDSEGSSAVDPYLNLHPTTLRTGYGSAEMADQFGGIAGLPTTLLIDREGLIAARLLGYIRPIRMLQKDRVNEAVISLLQE